MPIPTEPIGSVPRTRELLEGVQAFNEKKISKRELDSLYDAAVRDTIDSFERTGSPVITDGEQRKSSFATYPLERLENLAGNGVTIPFADGHTRQLPTLTSGPFRYGRYADSFLEGALKYTELPVKQAVISASAMSLLYPQGGIDGYTKDQFISDLKNEHEADIRRSLDRGADSVQIDFTEGRLSLKLDPSKALLQSFVALNNQVLDRFSADERKRIGVHTCPGGDQDSTHSADISYSELLPDLFKLNVGRFYIQLSSEKDRGSVLKVIKENAKEDQTIFVGVIDPINPNVESAEEVRDRVLEAAEYIPLAQLGTTDDCGFAPFGDDTSTSRDTAFEKIRARIDGTALAGKTLGVS